MSYTGDQLPSKRKFDKDGVLIDPEDTLIDSFLAAMNNYDISNCLRCKHLNDDGISCAAFPIQIPHEYASGFLKHNRPHKDDKGIMFEAKNLKIKVRVVKNSSIWRMVPLVCRLLSFK